MKGSIYQGKGNMQGAGLRGKYLILKRLLNPINALLHGYLNVSNLNNLNNNPEG